MAGKFVTYALVAPFCLFLTACGSGSIIENPIQQRLVESNIVNSDGSSNRFSYEYDANGNLLRRTVFVNNEMTSSRIYATNPNGLLNSYTDDSDADGTIDFTILYRYSDTLRLTRLDITNAEGIYIASTAYSYTDELITSREHFNIDDVETVEMIDLRPALKTSHRTFEYENGRLGQQSFFDGEGTLLNTRTYTYNTDGTLASSITNSSTEGTVQTSTHTYETGTCNSAANVSQLKYRCIN